MVCENEEERKRRTKESWKRYYYSEKGKAYLKRTKEHRKEINRKYYQEHKEKYNEWKKKNRSENKDRYEEREKKWRDKNREWIKERNRIPSRRSNLKRNYGITIEEYNELFEKQNGHCAICGKPQSEFKLAFAVDHNHKTGKIRGLLCSKCNFVLGYAEDNLNILQEAFIYLEKYNAMV